MVIKYYNAIILYMIRLKVIILIPLKKEKKKTSLRDIKNGDKISHNKLWNLPNKKRHPKPIVRFHGKKKRQQKWLINRFQAQKVVFFNYEYTFYSRGLKRPNIV